MSFAQIVASTAGVHVAVGYSKAAANSSVAPDADQASTNAAQTMTLQVFGSITDIAGKAASGLYPQWSMALSIFVDFAGSALVWSVYPEWCACSVRLDEQTTFTAASAPELHASCCGCLVCQTAVAEWGRYTGRQVGKQGAAVLGIAGVLEKWLYEAVSG